MPSDGIFGPSPGRCWECGSPSLRVVSDGDDPNFVCPSCGACWHVVLGHVHRVHSATCPGCDARPLRSPEGANLQGASAGSTA